MKVGMKVISVIRLRLQKVIACRSRTSSGDAGTHRAFERKGGQIARSAGAMPR